MAAGAMVGVAVGAMVGVAVGAMVGAAVGIPVGRAVACSASVGVGVPPNCSAGRHPVIRPASPAAVTFRNSRLEILGACNSSPPLRLLVIPNSLYG